MRRVVITGLGLVTPLACGVEETWSRLLAGQSGASPITKFKVDDLATKIACQLVRDYIDPQILIRNLTTDTSKSCLLFII